MIEWILAILLVVILIYLLWKISELRGTIENRSQEISELRGTIENRARALHEKWASTELEKQSQGKAELLHRDWMQKEERKIREDANAKAELRANEIAELLLKDWMQKEERKIREDAISRSEAVIRGKVTEHIIPFFPDFKYNPKDARFMGTPVDLVIFDGLNEGKLRNIVLVEVKTGKTTNLSDRERMVKNCIESKNVAYEIIHHETK
jgi:predicted Holliday junction resolvase-like endonuclease